jgi:uncharacterized membrane protein
LLSLEDEFGQLVTDETRTRRGRIVQAVIRGLALLLAVYLACWTVIYGFIMAGDFRYFLEYLSLAWSRPGEIPALIQLYTVAATIGICLIAGVVLLAMRRRRKSRA